MTMRILVTGSNLFFTARLIHDLGKRGVTVTAADSSWCSPGKLSRTVSRRLTLPSLNSNPAGYLAGICEELKRQHYDLLLPTFEESLLLAEYRHELAPLTKVMLPSFQAMCQLHDKRQLHDFCKQFGIPTPPTTPVVQSANLDAIADDIGFPSVLKLPTGNNSVGRMFCRNPQELRQNFDQLVALHSPDPASLPFLQKKIDGDLLCTLGYSYRGRKLGEVTYRTGRMFPEAGGTTVHRQSIRHAEIEQITDQIITETQWSGFLGFDFLVEHTTGIPYLIDANVRANPAIQLGFMSGIDWSSIILDLVAGREPQVQTAQEGINVHNLLLDISWLMEGLLPRAGGLQRMPQRIREFLHPAWQVHSRGDLLGLGEFASVTALAINGVVAGLRSLFTGRQPGEVLLENANYNPVTATRLRAHQEVPRQRAAA
ncbi:MAG: hypothetical protein WCJ09_10885 [Planctomycetota bacterium]